MTPDEMVAQLQALIAAVQALPVTTPVNPEDEEIDVKHTDGTMAVFVRKPADASTA